MGDPERRGRRGPVSAGGTTATACVGPTQAQYGSADPPCVDRSGDHRPSGRRMSDEQLPRRGGDRDRQVAAPGQVGVDRRGSCPALRRWPTRSATDRDRRPRPRTRRRAPCCSRRCARRCRGHPAPRRTGSTQGSCSTPVKPIARNTKSAGICRSVPSTGLEPTVDHLDLDQLSRPDPTVSVVDEALGRHRVHAVAALFVGAARPDRSSDRWATADRPGDPPAGRGRISSWVTDAAPCRCDVPRQSAPVSPPPMITTCLPLTSMSARSMSPSQTRLASGRNSIA